MGLQPNINLVPPSVYIPLWCSPLPPPPGLVYPNWGPCVRHCRQILLGFQLPCFCPQLMPWGSFPHFTVYIVFLSFLLAVVLFPLKLLFFPFFQLLSLISVIPFSPAVVTSRCYIPYFLPELQLFLCFFLFTPAFYSFFFDDVFSIFLQNYLNFCLSSWMLLFLIEPCCYYNIFTSVLHSCLNLFPFHLTLFTI